METQIKAYSIEEVEALMKEAKLPSFRSLQILQWIYAKNATSYDEMTNLPKAMREQLAVSSPLLSPTIEERLESIDGTRKYLLRFDDGAIAETVAIPSTDGRLSVCCSSQSGCGMRCSFCATGKLGLTRSLLPGEIVDQIIVAQEDFGKRVTNVVVMGQGEPFANYKNTIAALRIMNHPKLLNIGARHITISTCGLISGIDRFSEEPEQFTLAVSLHSAIQSTRDKLMPGCKGQPLDALRDAAAAYVDRTKRRISFEYALMKGINDSPDDLKALIAFCRNLICHVNLIPLNYIDGSPYEPVSSQEMQLWQKTLEDEGVSATIRNSRGADIAGACGQLAARRR